MTGRSHRGVVVALGLAITMVICAALAAQASREFSQRTPADAGAPELALFPSGRLLAEASLGHRQLLADVAWLAAIQYYGKHRLSDRRYPLAPHLLKIVTDADPAFRNAYLFGALVMAEEGELDKAEALLCKGVRANPRAWELWFELGFFHYVYSRSWPEAAQALRTAASIPGAAEYVRRFAAAASEQADEPEVAALLWRAVAEQSDNEEIRRIARERLEGLAAKVSGQPASTGG